MKRLFCLIPLLFGLLGCVQSLHPFYQTAQLFYDPSLAGTWTDQDQKNTFVITGDAANRQYTVAFTDDHGKTGRFIVHLAKTQDHTIADILPEPIADGQLNANDEYAASMIPVHTFLIVEYSPPDLSVRQMDMGWFNQYIQAHPNEVPNAMLDKGRWVLTGSPEQVQAFALKHLNTPGAYGQPQEMVRVPAAQPGARK